MDQIASKAKSTVTRIVKVPQQIGRTILSVPDNLLKQKQQRKQNNNELETDDDDDPELFIIGDTNNIRNTSKQHATLCTNIIEDQQVREVVRESQLQCLQEIMDHLQLYLFENNSTETSRYEGWIASLHPDNVQDKNNNNNNNNSSTSNYNISSGGGDDGDGDGGNGGDVREIIIDHRFYMKDSHHRQLWNEYMEKLECREAIVEGNKRSIKPTHTVRSLLLSEQTNTNNNDDRVGMGTSWFFPL